MAYPQSPGGASINTYHYVNSTAGSFQQPYASSTTFPFRVRGTQVRVYSETVALGNEAEGAIVYLLSEGEATGGFPLADINGTPFRTDPKGYLQGRGEIGLGDQLVALFPIRLIAHVNDAYRGIPYYWL